MFIQASRPSIAKPYFSADLYLLQVEYPGSLSVFKEKEGDKDLLRGRRFTHAKRGGYTGTNTAASAYYPAPGDHWKVTVGDASLARSEPLIKSYSCARGLFMPFSIAYGTPSPIGTLPWC